MAIKYEKQPGYLEPDEPVKGEKVMTEKIVEEILEIEATPKSGGKKKPTTIRLDVEVVEYFQSLGMGWQTRINHLLKGYVERKKREVK